MHNQLKKPYHECSIGMVMFSLESIKPHKDTSFAILLALKNKGAKIWQINPNDLWFDNEQPMCFASLIDVYDHPKNWFKVIKTSIFKLTELQQVWIRTDPPVDQNYQMNCWILAQTEQLGVHVVNRPTAILNWNEKLSILNFKEWIVPTIVSSNLDHLGRFLDQHQEIVLKPIHGMGGQGIFRLNQKDQNRTELLNLMTQNGTAYCIAQQFIQNVYAGDKRILLLHGKAAKYGLLRKPKAQEFRANLAAGGSAEAVALTTREKQIACEVGGFLMQHGIYFAGLDIINGYLTEINITSPTCLREIDAQQNTNLAMELLDGFSIVVE